MTGKRVVLSALCDRIYASHELIPLLETPEGKYRRADIIPNVSFGRDLGDTLPSTLMDAARPTPDSVVIEHVVRHGPFDRILDGMKYIVARRDSPESAGYYQVGVYTRA